MELDDLFTLLPSLFDFVGYLLTYPLTLLFNSVAGIVTMELTFVSEVFQTLVNTVVDVLNLFAWLPDVVKIVLGIFVVMLVVLLIARVIGRIIQVFYPSGLGD